MLRRIALTLVPCVALYTVAAFLAPTLAPRAGSKSRVAPRTTPVQQVAARSGYIVASS
jgi:hypothetical protein